MAMAEGKSTSINVQTPFQVWPYLLQPTGQSKPQHQAQNQEVVKYTSPPKDKSCRVAW
jgi:hypothetical protein